MKCVFIVIIDGYGDGSRIVIVACHSIFVSPLDVINIPNALAT